MFTFLAIFSALAIGYGLFELFEDDDDPVAPRNSDPDPDPDPDPMPDPDPDPDPMPDPDLDPDPVEPIIGDDGVATFGTEGDDVIISNFGTPIFGLAGNDLLTVESVEAAPTGTADGGEGEDTLTAELDAVLLGGDGNDLLEGLDGATLSGGNGDDILRITNGEARGLAGDDQIFAVNSNVNGDAGDDTLMGQSGSDVSGGNGNDLIMVESGSEGRGGSGDDTVIGMADTVVGLGQAAPERVVLEGNLGSDIVRGNTGVDIKDGQDASVLQAVIGQDDFYGVTNAPDGSTPAGLGAAVMTGFAEADQFEIIVDDLTDRSGEIWQDASLDIVEVFEDDPVVVINDFAVGEDMLVVDAQTPEDVEILDDGDGWSLVLLDFGQAEDNQGMTDEVILAIQLRGVATSDFDESMITFGTSTALPEGLI